jgi:hypothetical protein
MDVSPDHEPTLIERGTDVHLNHPIIAQRGTHDSKPARSESWTPHPLSRGRTAKGRMDKTESSSRSPRLGPGSGARRTATPPGYALNADECRYVCMAPPRPAETLSMPTETNTSHTGKHCEKTLQEHPCSCKASGGYTHGCASVPPRNSIATRREERPISTHQPLRVPNGYHRRGSEATVGDSHKGPLITGEKPISSQNDKKHK